LMSRLNKEDEIETRSFVGAEKPQPCRGHG
jgi:hypothetical protein